MIKELNIKLIIIILVFLSMTQISKSIEPCDSLRTCIGRNLKFKTTYGKGAHYVDVVNNKLLDKIGESLTFELWLKPEKQTGNKQYIGGLWGPGEGKNDSWAVYINSKDTLIFELNGLNDNFGDDDNTIVKVPIASYYDKWSHYSFVFNGKTGYAYIFVDGSPIDSNRNAIYPLNRLRKISNTELSIQLGSTNGISNDLDNNRTFKGGMDEIRIWGRALKGTEIFCQKDKALVGNEDSLLLYYRCNDPNYVFNLCDVSGHGNFAYMRSGLTTENSDRKDVIKIMYTIREIKDTILCDTEKFYDITAIDTSVCATGLYILAYQGDNSKFYLVYNNKEYLLTSWRYMPLTPLVPLNFKIKVVGDFIGSIKTSLELRNSNSCGYNIGSIPVSITRMTELSPSKLRVDFDSLKARCIEKPYIDSTIRLCNITNSSSNPRDLTISNIYMKYPEIYELSGFSLPLVIKPGACIDIKIRFISKDTTAQYFDTLKIESNDKCSPLAKIPVQGKVKEVIGIYQRGSKKRLDSINFGRMCINFPSDAVQYDWENLLDKDIEVKDIIIPTNFMGKTFKYPLILKPKTGYLSNYFRFLPKVKGNFNDSIIFVVNSNGCTIRKPLYVKGYGYDAEINFTASIIDFGNIVVGKETTLNVELENKSDEPLVSSIYLKQGDPFFLISKSINVPAKSKRTFPLTFRPSIAGLFNDNICIYENSCFQSFCIPVRGNAIIETFSFEPEVMAATNVLGCQSKDTSLIIRNLLSTQLTLTDFNLQQIGTTFKLINPATFPTSVTLKTNEIVEFKFNYSPNDNLVERADKALLRFKTQDKQEWSAKLYGSSVIPKVYMKDEILFPTIEVGGFKRDTITLENISNFDIEIDNSSISAGFELVYPLTLTGRILKPKDTIMVIVDFKPSQAMAYNGEFLITSTKPCSFSKKTILSGNAIIVPLDAPLKVISYGFVKPCDCQERTIPLINNSYYFDMKIDSIWIDSVNVASPFPQFYSWNTFLSPNSSLPYKIPSRNTDTLKIRFCPNNPFIKKLIDNDARLHIRASGNGWNNEFTTYLSGKQTLIFESDTQRVYFPPTRVDTLSKPQYIHIKIPKIEFNPLQAQVKISNYGFYQDERVFYASDSLNRLFPFNLDTGKSITIKLDFKPRAVRYYEDKLKITIESPCFHFDTSVTVSGSGFAPAFGLNFNFDNKNKKRDTFRIVNCDTLKIPVFTSRTIPANLVDIMCRMNIDTNKLKFIGTQSYYMQNGCSPYNPKIDVKPDSISGLDFSLKNFCNVDSLKPIFTALFLSKNLDRDTFDISIDSIHFDTEEVILYHLIAENDFGTVIIQKPEIKSVNSLSMNSVKVLDCVRDTLKFINNGDVPIVGFNLINLPNFIKIISSNPGLSDTVNIGETLNIVVEYCPRKKDTFDVKIDVLANYPCNIGDSTNIKGDSYAPEFPVGYNTSFQFSVPDTLTTRLGDTLIVPLFVEKDFKAFLNNKTYWIENLNFELELNYSPFSLKFLDSKSLISKENNLNYEPGKIILKFSDIDSLKAGKIAEIKFLSVIPDTELSDFKIETRNFSSDSIMFLDIIPVNSEGKLLSLGRCGLDELNYSGLQTILNQNIPNPWFDDTEISFTLSSKSRVNLELITIEGVLIKTLINNSVLMPNNYKLILNSAGLSNGIYFLLLRTDTEYIIKKLILEK